MMYFKKQAENLVPRKSLKSNKDRELAEAAVLKSLRFASLRFGLCRTMGNQFFADDRLNVVQS